MFSKQRRVVLSPVNTDFSKHIVNVVTKNFLLSFYKHIRLFYWQKPGDTIHKCLIFWEYRIVKTKTRFYENDSNHKEVDGFEN